MKESVVLCLTSLNIWQVCSFRYKGLEYTKTDNLVYNGNYLSTIIRPLLNVGLLLQLQQVLRQTPIQQTARQATQRKLKSTFQNSASPTLQSFSHWIIFKKFG